MSFPTYLEYTFAPDPLSTGTSQNIIIVGTLKSGAQTGLQQNSVTVKSITFDFGELGEGATQLTNTNFSALTTKVSGWNAKGNGAQCVLTPKNGSGIITGDSAIIMVIENVPVNQEEGNTTLTITEVAYPTTTPNKVGTGVQFTTVSKHVANDAKSTFTANPDHLKAGNTTTLNWDIPENSGATFSLHYLQRGQLIGPITQHHDGTPLSSNDQYPKGNGPSLVLFDTTVFVLSIQSNGTTRNMTVPVIVSEANIFASEATIPDYQGGNFSFLDGEETLLNITGSGGSTTITINTDGGTNSWTHLLLQNKSGAWTIGTSRNYEGNELHIQHPGGANMKLSTNGDLNVNGNLTVGGNINIQGRGGRNFVETLSSGNSFKLPHLFSDAGYRYYELIFNSPTPAQDNDHSFGARFYVNGEVQDKDIYYSNLYGNDEGAAAAESHNKTYLSLYPRDRSAPRHNLGLVGKMNLYLLHTIGCTALLYAPDTYNNSGCQVWVEGGINPAPTSAITGIEFNFYENGISGGYIDVYGWH